MRLFLSLFLITGIVTVIICYVMALMNDSISYSNCMLSEAIGTDPARMVGSFGISLTSFFLSVIFVARYMMSFVNNGIVKRSVSYLPLLGLSLSLFSCLGLMAVGIVSVIEMHTLHIWVMVITFGSLLLSLCIFSIEEWQRLECSVVSRKFIILRICLALGSIVMAVLMFWTIVYGEHFFGREHKGFLSALFEMITLFLFNCYIATFYNDFGKVQFSILATPRQICQPL